MNEWNYYNHAMIPNLAPHQCVNVEYIESGEVWKADEHPLLAQWSSDWDCGVETEWWYVIKDSPFQIEKLKAKRRYEINKGKKYFTVQKVDPKGLKEELYRITIEAYSSWPKKYRPSVDQETFFASLDGWDDYIVYGAFDIDTGCIEGYAVLYWIDRCLAFSMLRVNPKAERKAVNAAIVATILEDNAEKLSNGCYICDGARSIRHETAFQDYLEKYFGFRKAYCKLNLQYVWYMRFAVNLLYPFRRFIKTDSSLGSNIAGILKLEEIRRSC